MIHPKDTNDIKYVFNINIVAKESAKKTKVTVEITSTHWPYNKY